METKTDDFLPNYWFVGASFGGQSPEENEKQFQSFIKKGIWYGWEPQWNENPTDKVVAMQQLVRQIKEGDRIAIKKSKIITGSATAIIRAIGIVIEVDLDEWRVYVQWLPVGKNGSKEIFNREVLLKGRSSTIHGTFARIKNENHEDDTWIHEIFCI